MDKSSGPARAGTERAPGEFELIAALRQAINRRETRGDLVVGIGDDAAGVELESGVYVMTTDTMVDGVHFRRGQAHWADVGWKSAVSNLSDVAAMGALPLHALVTIGLPADVGVEQMERMYSGMLDAFGEFGGEIAGGDVVGAPAFFVTVALTGRARSEGGPAVLLRRSTAEPGDLIGVTGSLGGPAGGLRAITESLEGEAMDALRRMHFRPVPRIEEAGRLIDSGVVCAMDISDGLVGDLGKLCAASGVGAVVDSASVPFPPELETAFGRDDATRIALSGGEDYELLFTAPFDLMDRVLARNAGRVTHIGRVVEEPDEGPRVTVLDGNGNSMELESEGWDHLAAK